jgi:hypothetical protein
MKSPTRFENGEDGMESWVEARSNQHHYLGQRCSPMAEGQRVIAES